MIETKENNVLISEKILDVKLVPTSDAPLHALPAPVTPKTVKICEYDTEVTIDVILYLQEKFPANSINYCTEVIIDSTKKNTEKRIISIIYDYNQKKSDVFVPHVYSITIPDISVDKQEVSLLFYLNNEDPVTSRGTTTTVKREM
ncbi:MAG: hypothetical protein AAF617_09210 [Bacteroidota bacterium]